jgi:hypothetical protein
LPNSIIDAISSGIDRYLAAAADAQRLVDPGHEEDQLHEARALDDVAKAVDAVVAGTDPASAAVRPGTWTKPGLPPRGEASTLPSEPE